MGLAASKQEAFWEACGFGHVNRVKKFLSDENIDVNWVSYTHNCCAIHVASQGKKEIVKMLLEKNCHVNVKDDRGNLPLHHAAMKGHHEIIQMLITAGSQINTPDKNGWTALINAAYWCYPEVIRLLIKHKCDVNFQNKDDRTALHEACRSHSEDEEGLAEIVDMLIQQGCDINSKSSDVGEADFTPLMFASYHGHPGVAKALIRGNCDINAQGSKNKWTALHWAADRGHKDIVEILLAAGVDPMIEANHDELAMHRAKDNEIRDILERAVIEARGVCETDEELDESTEAEDEKEDTEDEKHQNDEETEEDLSEKTDVPSVMENGATEELMSPVRSIPDVMEKDGDNEKDLLDEINDFSICSQGGVSEGDQNEASQEPIIIKDTNEGLVNGDVAVPDRDVEKVLAEYAAEGVDSLDMDTNGFMEDLKDDD